MLVSNAEVEAAARAYLAHCERFVIYQHGLGAANCRSSVFDEGTEGAPLVYGPASDCHDWHMKHALRAALEAAAAVRLAAAPSLKEDDVERLRAALEIARGALLCIAGSDAKWASYATEVADAVAAPLIHAPDGWRDIASAPRDRFIFVYCPEDKSRWLAKWQSDQWYGVDEQGLTRSSNHWRVAHWRPLPEPPAAPKGSAND